MVVHVSGLQHQHEAKRGGSEAPEIGPGWSDIQMYTTMSTDIIPNTARSQKDSVSASTWPLQSLEVSEPELVLSPLVLGSGWFISIANDASNERRGNDCSSSW